MQEQARCFQIIQTGSHVRFGAGFIKSRKQHRCQNCDDGNYNQQFDQGKFSFHFLSPF
jgi:hypothetical protein